MVKNYIKIDQNENLTSFLHELKEDRKINYIILDTNPESFIDVSTIAFKVKDRNEKLKNLKKNLPTIDSDNSLDNLVFLTNAAERIVKVRNGYFDLFDGLEVILNSDSKLLSTRIKNNVLGKLISVNSENSIDSAKQLLKDNKINLLPVVDTNNVVVGEVRVRNLLITELYNTGDKEKFKKNRGVLQGSSETGVFRKDFYEDNIKDLPVSNIMETEIRSIDFNRTYKDLIEMMIKEQVPSVIITQDEKAYSVVTYKNVFRLFLDELKEDTYNIEFSGINEIPKPKLDFMREISSRFMEKIQKFSKYSLLDVSFKTHGNTLNTQEIKYSLNIVLSEGNKIIRVDREIVEGISDEATQDRVKGRWSLLDSFQDAIKALEARVKEEKERAKR